MPPIAPIFRKAGWSLVIGTSLYAFALLLLTHPPIQRLALYGHKVHTAALHDLNRPEQYGFAKNQVTPFRFNTSDNESLYAWHVLPLGLYAKHESELLEQPTGFIDDVTKSKSFRLLQDEPGSRLIISFHGNSGTVAQGWRTDTYRALVEGSTSDIHILTFDYRGFGHSSGSPTEEGVVLDGIAAVDWAMQIAKIPRERIVIIGQSMGTFVASAVAEHYANEGVEFAGLVLVAGFTDLPGLLSTYAIAGYIAPLAPIRRYPKLTHLLTSRLIDTWPTAERLAGFVRVSKRVRLFILHALDDREIPWVQSQRLFAVAANATVGGGMDLDLIERTKARNTVDFGDGTFISTWKTGDNKIIRQQVIGYGGHSRVVTYAPIALAALKAFELDEGGLIPE